MKNVFVTFLFVATISQSYSQVWNNNIDLALQRAAATNKKVLIWFTVTENCDNCHKLEQKVFKTSTFTAFAEDNYILVKLDFSQDQNELSQEQVEKNFLIVEKYNKDGFFPLVVVLNKTSKVLGKIGVYKDETPSEFIRQLQNFNG